jgi:hypothetical protein
MTMSKQTQRQVHALEKLRLPELQARFAEVTGEKTRSPNRAYLVRRISEAMKAADSEAKAAKAKAPAVDAAAPAGELETEDSAEATPTGEKLSKLDVPALQARYLEVVGRPTSSSHAGYLCWKIREAQKGRIMVGPRKTVRREGVTFKVLPLRLESNVVDRLDEVWRRRGIRSRTEFLRQAMESFASSLGEPELAAVLGRTEEAGGEL